MLQLYTPLRGILFAFSIAVLSMPGNAQVFYAKDEALERAFPDSTEVVTRTFVINDKQAEKIQRVSHSKLQSRIVNFFEGRQGDKVLGYALIDSGIVRTNQAIFLTLMSPKGVVEDVYVLAFYEPPDYLPTDKWLEQFEGESSPEQFNPGREVAGILGSTLSVHAITFGVKRALALYELFFRDQAAA